MLKLNSIRDLAPLHRTGQRTVKGIVAVFLGLILCAPVGAAPQTKAAPEHAAPSARPAVSPAEYAADRAYVVRFMDHIQGMVGILKKVGSQFQSTQPHDEEWKQRIKATLKQMQGKAHAGRKMPAPPLFHPVQRVYSTAMMEYEDAARGLPAAIDAADTKAGEHYAAEVKQATATMQRAAMLLRALTQQK